MIDFLLEPLGYAFMVRGLIASIMVGIVCAVVGTYVVLRGMAFFGDALAHSILPGIAIGYLVGNGARQPLFWWALIAAILSSLGIGAISRSTKIKEDTAIGIIFAGTFALGVALISTVRSYTVDLAHFLFGDVLGVRAGDLWLIAAFGGLVVLLVLAFYKEFMVLSFDPVLAATLRLPVRFLDILLLILIAVTIVVSLGSVSASSAGIVRSAGMLGKVLGTMAYKVKQIRTCAITAVFVSLLHTNPSHIGAPNTAGNEMKY